MKACNACPAGLLCIAGVARFYLRTVKEAYVYTTRGTNTHAHVDILLSLEEMARCWKVQAILAGKNGRLAGIVAMSGTTRNAVRNARERRAERGES